MPPKRKSSKTSTLPLNLATEPTNNVANEHTDVNVGQNDINIISTEVPNYGVNLGPLGTRRNDEKGNELCQFPLCNDVCFIFDENLNISLCFEHRYVGPGQLKLATRPSNYRSNARGIQYFFTRTSTQTEIIAKTAEINKDMELDTNRKRYKPQSVSTVTIDTVSNVSLLTSNVATAVPQVVSAKSKKFVGTLQCQDKAIKNLIQSNADDPTAQVFEISKDGILCTVCIGNCL